MLGQFVDARWKCQIVISPSRLGDQSVCPCHQCQNRFSIVGARQKGRRWIWGTCLKWRAPIAGAAPDQFLRRDGRMLVKTALLFLALDDRVNLVLEFLLVLLKRLPCLAFPDPMDEYRDDDPEQCRDRREEQRDHSGGFKEIEVHSVHL